MAQRDPQVQFATVIVERDIERLVYAIDFRHVALNVCLVLALSTDQARAGLLTTAILEYVVSWRHKFVAGVKRRLGGELDFERRGNGTAHLRHGRNTGHQHY